MTDTPWRLDPDLQGMFPPGYPDDLQVVVHDGEPRRTQASLEACWVRTTRVAGRLRAPIATAGLEPPVTGSMVSWIERVVYEGTLLNQPHGLKRSSQGDLVQYIFAPGLPHPLQVHADYLAERPRWAIVPCDQCGTDQTLDPPELMARTRFPNQPPEVALVSFSAFCLCGGVMVLAQVEGLLNPAPGTGFEDEPTVADQKPWWKIW